MHFSPLGTTLSYPFLQHENGKLFRRRSLASFLPLLLGMTGFLYGTVAAALDALFLLRALQLWRSYDDDASWRLFRYSIAYLGGIFAALFLDRLLMPWLPTLFG